MIVHPTSEKNLPLQPIEKKIICLNIHIKVCCLQITVHGIKLLFFQIRLMKSIKLLEMYLKMHSFDPPNVSEFFSLVL